MLSKIKRYTFCAMSLLFSLVATANDNENNFQVAVVENAPGTSDIFAGRYQQGMSAIGKTNESNSDTYEVALGACTASLMSSKLEDAEQACSSAIFVHKEKKARKYRYLTSIAYSNRSIVKYKKGDFEGAFNDLTTAAALHKNNLVKGNLSSLKSSMAKNKMVPAAIVSE